MSDETFALLLVLHYSYQFYRTYMKRTRRTRRGRTTPAV